MIRFLLTVLTICSDQGTVLALASDFVDYSDPSERPLARIYIIKV